jgi:hypothetical protein
MLAGSRTAGATLLALAVAIFVSAPSSHAAVEATCMGETATIVGTENSDTLNGTEGAASTPCGSRMAQRAG